METKFTKGYWGITITPEYHEPKCSRIEIHSNRQEGWICKVQTDGLIDRNEGLANAKLIASAPLMFKLLSEIADADVCQKSGLPMVEPIEEQWDRFRDMARDIVKMMTE